MDNGEASPRPGMGPIRAHSSCKRSACHLQMLTSVTPVEVQGVVGCCDFVGQLLRLPSSMRPA
eukprot:4548593-Pyramimonas_sp.AAC.1